MGILEHLQSAMRHLRINKLRSALTMLGIIIGIAAIIAALAVGEGGRSQVDSELKKFGINRFWIYPSSISNSTLNTLSRNDAELLRARLKDAEVCASAYRITRVNNTYRSARAEVVGTEHNLIKMANITLVSGSFISEADVKYRRCAAVINQELAHELFRDEDPIGKKIQIGVKQYVVIGVESKASGFAKQSAQGKCYIPISAYEAQFNTSRLDEISISTDAAAEIEGLGNKAVGILQQKHGISGGYATLNLVREMELADSILNTFKLVVSAIAGISLIVGGIGIMNIMLVSVKERTQEIGIRKALGAKRKQILMQFLAEAICYGLIGGLVGVFAGITGSKVLAAIIGIRAIISPEMVLLPALFALSIGLFFGIYPASKAADLDPAEALRYQ